MSEFHPETAEKRPEKSEVMYMNAVAEASCLLKQIAEPRPVGDSVKQAIDRAARRVSRYLSPAMRSSRAEDIWRQEARAIRAEEMDAIRKAAQADRLRQEGRNELAAIDARLARLEAILVQDEEFNRHQVAAHREALRGPPRPLDGGLGKVREGGE